MTPRAVFLAASISLLAALAGCGGGGDDTSTATGPPSKTEFVDRVNASCKEIRAVMEEERRTFERRRAGKKPEPDSVDMVHLVYLPAMEEQASRIRVLELPRGEEERVEEVLDEAENAINAAAVVRRIPTIAAAERYFEDSDRLYLAYGLDDCANPGARATSR